MKKLHIDTGRSYDILIGSGLLKQSGKLCAEALKRPSNPGKLLLISDENVQPLYEKVVLDSLLARGFEVFTFNFPAGENHKNMSTVSEILSYLAEMTFTRGDALVALGGGITGDITGFAASIYLRGLPFVQIPTTFLSAVDSSVGGKTGVNLPLGKNLVGSFWQPSLVLCDPDTFRTLSYEVFLDGVAESLKYGVIADSQLFYKLCQEGSGLFQLNTESSPDSCAPRAPIEQIIERCLKIKADIVKADEFDLGQRQLLNFGHTLGHAIEKSGEYKISHGHAVAIGMLMISKAAAAQGICDAQVPEDIEKALGIFGFPYKQTFEQDELIKFASRDKKRSGDYINLVLPKKIGECFLQKIPATELHRYIERI